MWSPCVPVKIVVRPISGGAEGSDRGSDRAVTIASIRRNDRHRIKADPNTCPVCCGDRKTDDPRYGGKELYRVEAGSVGSYPIFECLACPVWKQEQYPDVESAARHFPVGLVPLKAERCPDCGPGRLEFEDDVRCPFCQAQVSAKEGA